MERPFRFRDGQPIVWFHRKLERSNQCCLYCFRFLGDGAVPSNREHLIGRAFVPPGTFDKGQEFNFIFRACEECNGAKAECERHVSTITLFRSPARSSDKVDAVATRKASSDFHPVLKGKRVDEAGSEMSVELRNSMFDAKVGFVGPPQLAHDYVRQLALWHTQGLFSLIASPAPLQVDGLRVLPPERHWLGRYYFHADWGNALLLELARRVRTWTTYVNVVSAGGFFKAVLKRDESGTGQGFWALEWNKSLRVVGGIAESEPEVFDELPDPGWHRISDDTRVRQERSLAPGEDTLFE